MKTVKQRKQYNPEGRGQNEIIELKDFDQNKGLVTFYFADFNTRDSDNDIIVPGAYKKTIEEHRSRLKHFYNHNPEKVPGVIVRIEEDTKGAFATSQLAKSDLGRNTLIEYESGIITEHSQGFNTMLEEFDTMAGVNMIKEIRLWEVSSLTHWGANENTPMVDVKNLKDPIKMFESLNYILHKSNITDERGAELNELYNELGVFIKSLGETRPANATDDKEPIIKDVDLLDSFKNKLTL